MRERILAIAAAVLLAACAAPAPPIAIPDIERSAAASVRDLRPGSEKEATHFSLLITNDAYGTGRVGDDPVKPPPVRVLQHRAFEKFGALAGALSIDVHHFVIYRNLQAFGRRVALGAAFGAVGSVIAGGTATQRSPGGSTVVSPDAFASVGADEWKLAMFSPAEDPGPVISYIVYLDTEIQGRRAATRTVFPSQDDNANLAIPAAVEAAIAFHLAHHANEWPLSGPRAAADKPAPAPGGSASR